MGLVVIMGLTVTLFKKNVLDAIPTPVSHC